jgi:putative effector of murein hydrolase
LVQNSDSSGPGKRDDLIDQITGAAEMLSFVLVAVPFGCMAALVLIVLFSWADYVFLPGGILRLLLPAAVFALAVQLWRILRKRPADRFSRFMLGFGLLGLPAGLCAWILAGLS